MNHSVVVHLTENNYALLAQKADLAGSGTSVAMIIRDLVANWCADRRAAKRLTMGQAHYTARDGSDFEEVG